VLCGGIANYNATEPPPGPKNYLNLILQRGRMEGFIVLDYLPRASEAIGALASWVQAGKLKNKVDVQHGLENALATLRRLFEGRNDGKQLLRVPAVDRVTKWGPAWTTFWSEPSEAASRKFPPSSGSARQYASMRRFL
jgi:hypothetical protein